MLVGGPSLLCCLGSLEWLWVLCASPEAEALAPCLLLLQGCHLCCCAEEREARQVGASHSVLHRGGAWGPCSRDLGSGGRLAPFRA